MVLIALHSFEVKMVVVPKFAREGVGSYLVWLPWCPRSLSASFNMQLLCVYKVADSNSTGMYVAYVWLVAREIDTWTIDGDV